MSSKITCWPTLVLSLVVAAMFVAVPAQADGKVALVIGNSHYQHVAHLSNPVSDVAIISAALRRAGFSTVEIKTDLDASGMRTVLHDFASVAASADVALVYYAGHGMEMGNTNYLIPVDASLARDTDVQFETISLDLVLHAVAGAKQLRIVVLDACRNNPFAAQMTGQETRAVSRGLARIELNGANTLVAFAARDGTTAEDGAGANSPFASAFARDVSIPGLEVRRLFGKVRDDVLAATGKRQEPFVYGSMGGGEFYFVPAPASTMGAASSAPVTPKTDAAAMELALWNSVAESKSEAQLQTYLDQYPHGVFASIARAKAKALRSPAAPRQEDGAMELALWNSVAGSNDPKQLQSYLNQYPAGVFAGTARLKIAALERKPQAPTIQHLSSPTPTLAEPRIAGLNADVQRAVDQAYAVEARARTKADNARRAQKLAQEAAAEASPIPSFVTSNGTYRFDNQLSGWEHAGQFHCANAQACGFGVRIWRNGDRFEGEWTESKMIGVGVFTYASGARYEGQWDDSYFGEPKKVIGVEFAAPENSIRETAGQFDDDKINGFGVVHYRDGTVAVGSWKKGRFNGLGVKLDAQGRVAEQGRYDGDKLTVAMTP